MLYRPMDHFQIDEELAGIRARLEERRLAGIAAQRTDRMLREWREQTKAHRPWMASCPPGERVDR